MKVLCVDDNATNRELLSTHLSGAGMVCHTVSDGRTAIQALLGCADSAPYELAILDQNMPRMTGRELARLIQQEPRLRGLRLILIGSVGRTLGENEREELGISAYATKPIWKKQLLHIVESTLRGPHVARASAAPELPTDEPRAARGKHILLVEDSPINAEVAGEILRVAGYTFDFGHRRAPRDRGNAGQTLRSHPDGLLPARTRRL